MSLSVDRKDSDNETFTFKNFVFKDSNEQKILRVTKNDKLNFQCHIKNM